MIQKFSIKWSSSQGVETHLVLAKIIGPFAIHVCDEPFSGFRVSHVQTGLWITWCADRFESLTFVRQLISLDLNWSFSDPLQMSREAYSKLSKFVHDWENRLIPDDDSDLDDDYDKWEVQQERIARKKLKKSRLVAKSS